MHPSGMQSVADGDNGPGFKSRAWYAISHRTHTLMHKLYAYGFAF
jgi:hypothetical protein